MKIRFHRFLVCILLALSFGGLSVVHAQQHTHSRIPLSGPLGPQHVPSMHLEKDEKNPKILYVGGVKITGPDGFILPGMEQQARHIRNKASALGIIDPLAGVKERP